jgi:hypothetical protein
VVTAIIMGPDTTTAEDQELVSVFLLEVPLGMVLRDVVIVDEVLSSFCMFVDLEVCLFFKIKKYILSGMVCRKSCYGHESATSSSNGSVRNTDNSLF